MEVEVEYFGFTNCLKLNVTNFDEMWFKVKNKTKHDNYKKHISH